MIDLSTTYLGLRLRTPLVASASPLSQEIDGIRHLEDAGASAVVLYSLFEEQLRQESFELEHHMASGTDSFAEAASFFPQPAEFHLGPEGYLNHIRKAKDAVKIPIIASLNGSTLGGWAQYARQIEQAGADAIECNIYFIPTNQDISSSDVEKTSTKPARTRWYCSIASISPTSTSTNWKSSRTFCSALLKRCGFH
jgi:dihydroorotate dehydrogenase (fumarate)